MSLAVFLILSAFTSFSRVTMYQHLGLFMEHLSMCFSPSIKHQIEIRLLRGVGQELGIEVISIHFVNGFRNPAFTFGAEPPTFGLNSIFVPGPDALIHIFILRNAVLPRFCVPLERYNPALLDPVWRKRSSYPCHQRTWPGRGYASSPNAVPRSPRSVRQ